MQKRTGLIIVALSLPLWVGCTAITGFDDYSFPGGGDGDGDACIDEDGDGFGQNCEAGEDCDDTIAEINPDSEEVCDDVDNNCNNEIDEGCDCIEEGADCDPGDPDLVCCAGLFCDPDEGLCFVPSGD